MKPIAILLGDGWADWEAGPLLGAAGYFLKLPVTIATPNGAPVRSAGGLTAAAAASFSSLDPASHSAIALIGGPVWLARVDGVGSLLRAAAAAEVPVGGICAGTIELARAGLLDDRAHTSNGVGYLGPMVPEYAGVARYVDVPRAIRDRGVVTAPGIAPTTFAVELLRSVVPDAAGVLDQVLAQSAREYRP